MGINEFVKKKRAEPHLHAAWVVADVANMAGAVLRALRSRTPMKQGEIAAALEISQPRVSQIESGKVENLPPLDLMARYADACGDSLFLTTGSEHDALVAEVAALRAEVAALKGAEQASRTDVLERARKAALQRAIDQAMGIAVTPRRTTENS